MQQTVIVGKISKFIKLDGKKAIELAVTRNFKNKDGEYEIDFIPVKIFDNHSLYILQVGDIVGVRGRITRLNGQELRIVAENISFLKERESEK